MARQQKRNWLERTILSVGVILVSATLGILVYDMVVIEDSPPAIVVSAGKIERGQQHYALYVTAMNNGRGAAQGVIIEIKLGKADNEEKATLEFPFIPGNSTVSGWVTFRQDPSDGNLDFRVLGYSTP